MIKKKWKPPVMIPGVEKNDPMAALAQEEAAVRSPNMAPGFWDLPEDERVGGAMNVAAGVRNLVQQKKDAAQQPAAEQTPKPRDNMTSPAPQIIIQTQPTNAAPRAPQAQPDIMQMIARRMNAAPAVPTLPTNVGDLRSAIYGTKPQTQGVIPQQAQDPDELMAMIAQRLSGGSRR